MDDIYIRTDDDQKLYDRFSSIKNALRTQSQGKIVLIGDIVLDRYIHGSVENLNSRAPVPRTKYLQLREQTALSHNNLCAAGGGAQEAWRMPTASTK